VTKKPVSKPKVKAHEDKEKKWFAESRKGLWRRIEEAKRPPTHPPEWEVSADGLPLVSLGRNDFRLQARYQDFEDTLYFMRLAFKDALASNNKLSAEQREHLSHMRDVFEESISRLRIHLPHNEANMDLIEGMIAAAYELGTFCGRHPIKEKVHTTPASKGKRHIERQERLAITKPLVLAARETAELKSKKAPSITKHIRPALEKELKARGMPIPKPDTIRGDVEDILAGRL
jgi:hypothetical protein